MSDADGNPSDRGEKSVEALRVGRDLSAARADPKARRGNRVREIDFSRPSKFSPDTQRRFERAHQTFCRSASTQLGGDLRSVIELEVIDLDQLSFSVAIGRVPQPSLYGLVETEPLGTTILVAIELSLVLRMIDRLLGGTGELKGLRPELTEIEMAIARQLFCTVVAPLSVVWEELLGLTLRLREVEVKLANMTLAPSSEPTLTITIEATLGGSPETIAMVIPYRAIEAAEERLSASNYGEGVVDPKVRERVQRAVSGADVDLRVEAAAVMLPLDDVLAFQPGDIVKLGTDASAGVTVFAGAVPVHRARPGRSGTKRAVEILDRWQHPA